MKVTQNLKNKVLIAKKAGYTHVSSICHRYKYTTYRHYVRIDEILISRIGTNLTRPKTFPGQTSTQFYSVHQNAQAISFSDLFKITNFTDQNQE